MQSDPEDEFDEILLKARALMRALAAHADPSGEFKVHEGEALPAEIDEPAARQSSRRSAAQRESSWRLESWSLRSTEDTCASTVFGEMSSRRAISLYM